MEARPKGGGGAEQSPAQSAVKVSRRQMRFNLLAAGVLQKRLSINLMKCYWSCGISYTLTINSLLFSRKATTCEVQMANYLPDWGFSQDTWLMEELVDLGHMWN